MRLRSAEAVVRASPWRSTGSPDASSRRRAKLRTRRALGVARARHDAHGDDDPAGLVRNGETDPLFAEIDREDTHDLES